MAKIYKDILSILKKKNIMDPKYITEEYERMVEKNMLVPLNTHYTSEIKNKYSDSVPCTDSVFFLPVIDRVFEMTKI